MVSQISAVINTLNEEKNIKQAIKSIDWVGEIIVVDDGSTDNTIQVLEELKKEGKNLKIYKHQSKGYVEPARNFAISKASNEWILILDADEQLIDNLLKKLIEIITKTKQIDYIRIPRKNIIFGRWMKASMWWPDYNIRFFKKGKVKWGNQIHRPPQTIGQGLDLPADEKYAIIHYNYDSISGFLERMNRYTNIQAREIKKEGYKFNWKDLIEKPLSEFLSRFFANRGYQDGLHGLALSFLQAFSFMIVYLKLWEMDKFANQGIDLSEINSERNKSGQAINYWLKQTRQGNFFKQLFKRLI